MIYMNRQSNWEVMASAVLYRVYTQGGSMYLCSIWSAQGDYCQETGRCGQYGILVHMGSASFKGVMAVD